MNGDLRQIRQFGIVCFLLCFAAGIALLRQGNSYGWIVTALAALMAVACWRRWPGLERLYAVWMWLGRIMARITTPVLLTLLYVGLLTPLALIARISGHRFLDNRMEKGRESYWQQPRKDQSNCEKQF